jgi:Uma2 family endonuclease
MLGLEYLLLFGVPENKWELLDGRIRWAFPFLDRKDAQEHFAAWTDTLRRWWNGADFAAHDSTTADGSPKRVVRFDGVEMSLYPRPIDLRMRIKWEVFDSLYPSFWRRDFWPGQDLGKESGKEWAQRHHDVRHNLWSLFGDFCGQYGGNHCSRSAIALNDRNAVEPDHYYFQASRDECMIERGYFHGVPDLIAEVLSPATRALDRGPRMEVYRRAGVPHLWLLDPETDILEEYVLADRRFDRTGRHGPGTSLRPALFPDHSVAVDSVFDTQEKRFARRKKHDEPGTSQTTSEPVPKWLVSPNCRVGLEALFFFGHPEQRYEIWNNRAPCVLAFGSPEEAELRFGHFLQDICGWEQISVPKVSPMEPGVDVAEVGRFQLTRRGSLVHLDVAVDGRRYRELLRVWPQHQAWDWGGD